MRRHLLLLLLAVLVPAAVGCRAADIHPSLRGRVLPLPVPTLDVPNNLWEDEVVLDGARTQRLVLPWGLPVGPRALLAGDRAARDHAPARLLAEGGIGMVLGDAAFLDSLLAPGDGPATGTAGDDRPTVVLVGGLFGTHRIFGPLSRRLRAEDVRVVSVASAGHRRPVTAEARRLDRVLRRSGVNLADARWAAHSYGSLVLREHLPRRLPGHEPRVVLLAPPSRGALKTRQWENMLPAVYRTLTGPAGEELRPDGGWSSTAPADRPPLPGPTLVIRGGLYGVGFNPLLGGDDDWTLRAVETVTPARGPVHYMTVPAWHLMVARSRRAADATVEFLVAERVPAGARSRPDSE